jgi:dienelactone hydrolase
LRYLLALLICFCAVGAAAQEPATAPPLGVVERRITLGKAPWAVPAIVTVAKGSSGVAGLVLLHGFGPGTVDGDVGPNKIFRETAWALAERGVATIRFAKRTTAHRELFRARGTHATVAEEWIDDAGDAIAALRTQPEVDTRRIYVVGHSASAGLAPRIALINAAAGAILVSGGAARFQTPGAMIVDQATYVAGLKRGDAAAVADALMTAAEARRLDDPREKDETVVLRHPLWYWRQLNSYDPVHDIREVTRRGGRALIVQGGRDYLVGPLQWSGWETTLGANAAVTRHIFPLLNHMMQSGSGKMTPEEYGERRPVAGEFTDLLAAWAKASDRRLNRKGRAGARSR